MSNVASQIALMIMRLRMNAGYLIEIPSLKIVIGRYSVEPAGWHPPFASGYSPDQNFVEVRP